MFDFEGYYLFVFDSEDFIGFVILGLFFLSEGYGMVIVSLVVDKVLLGVR